MRAFRICLKEFGVSSAPAFNGIGGLYAPGRWNNIGRPIVYSASTLSLASLEVYVHLKDPTKIKPFVYYVAEIPDHAIAEVPTLPPSWENDEAFTRSLGDAWLAEKGSPVLAVPSAVIPTEVNFLLNPNHPDFSLEWVISGPHTFSFDKRLLSKGKN